MSPEMQYLMDAMAVLTRLRMEVCGTPGIGYTILLHAYNHMVEEQKMLLGRVESKGKGA